MKLFQRKGDEHSAILRKARNASRGKTLSAALDENAVEHIYLNGGYSPAVERLIDEVGIQEAWKFLAEQGIAVNAKDDGLVRRGIFG